MTRRRARQDPTAGLPPVEEGSTEPISSRRDRMLYEQRQQEQAQQTAVQQDPAAETREA